MRVLAGDVGGTNTRLALFEGPQVVARLLLPTAQIRGVDEAIEQLLAAAPFAPQAACIALAGPVHRGFGRLTNVGWSVDVAHLAARFGFPFLLINDFHAQAAAVLALDAADLVKLGGGEGIPEDPIAVLGPGTGLGEAYVVPLGGGAQRIVATEGSHARFAPRDEREIGLLRALAAQYGRHVSVERVLSGPGLVDLYDHLRGARPRHEAMGREDPAAVVTRLGLAGECPACVEALEVFVGVLGDEAANLALKTGARRGVFLTGGIAPRLLPLLQSGRLYEAFVDKGRFRGWIEEIPLFLVTHPDPGLLGARIEAVALAGVR